jgi:hypothetical protein
MSETQDKKTTEVLRTRRLEIVDDDGKVRAVLGTNEEGVTSLAVFDHSKRLRISLDASENPEQVNGLGVFDTNGKHRGSLGAYEDGQSSLSFSAAGRDRHMKMGAADGNHYLMLTDEGAPMVGLSLAEEDEELSTDLALMDKAGRAGVVVSDGSRSDPQIKLADRRHQVRGFFGLGVGGEPRLYVADEEGNPIGSQSALGRVVAERGIIYQALLYGTVLVLFACAIGGAWIAGTVSASGQSLPAALITTVVLAVLVGMLIASRRSR